MKMYVGLGNPGKKYENTRHNVGFLTIDAFLKKTDAILDQNKFQASYTKIRIKNNEVLVVKPQTYMNASGEAVRALADYYKIEDKDIIIIYDDIDLPLGKLRLRSSGSGGNHNGIKSVIQHMGTKDINRIRIGVDKDPLIEQKDYVLGKFKKEEISVMNEAFSKAADALIDYVDMDFDKLMNRYNTGDK